MKKVLITPKMEAWAQRKAIAQVETEGFIRAIDTHESVYVGYLGEAAWWSCHPTALHADSRDYDFILDGETYDVKSYWSKYKPREGYTAYIPAKNMNRGKGFYYIVAVLPETKKAYLIGQIECERFKQIADFRKNGQKKEGRSGYFKCDCYEILLSELTLHQEKKSYKPPTKDTAPQGLQLELF